VQIDFAVDLGRIQRAVAEEIRHGLQRGAVLQEALRRGVS
jgi:hypothetical protein